MLIAEMMREWRHAKRYSLRDAEKIIGIKFTTLSRIENKKPVDSKTLMKLLNKLFAK